MGGGNEVGRTDLVGRLLRQESPHKIAQKFMIWMFHPASPSLMLFPLKIKSFQAINAYHFHFSKWLHFDIVSVLS